MYSEFDVSNRNVHGLAVHKKVLRAAQYEDTVSGNFWTRAADPCENCKSLIEIHGGDLQNLYRFAGSAGAPA